MSTSDDRDPPRPADDRSRSTGLTPMPDDSDLEERERYRELLEELRTILPGVQVLLAFLLTVPFTQRFEQVDALGRGLYAAATVGVAAAMVVFLTPASYHRVAPRQHRSDRLRVGIRMVVAGMALLAVSTLLVLFVVLRFLFVLTVATTTVATLTALVLVLWYVVPLHQRLTRSDRRGRAVHESGGRHRGGSTSAGGG